MKNKKLKIFGIILLALIALVLVFAKVNRITPLSMNSKTVNQPMFSDEAINGYDAVAYITEGKAVLGDKAISHQWKDATWYFASESNKSLFMEMPEKYAPQYGGFCAFAVSKGFTANTSPESYEIIDGKIYFFADDAVKADWKSNLEENLKAGDNNWK